MDYVYYMEKAYKNAQKAILFNETPIGCVIVFEDTIIGSAFNLRNTEKNSLYHAEIMAIDQACKHMGDWRLEGCTLFVTIEPCPMCAGAILQARIKEVVFGAKNRKAGCAGSVIDILGQTGFNHTVNVVEGIMEEECAALMSSFFKSLREKRL